MELFNKDEYIEPEKLPLKNLDVVRIKGDAEAGIPNRYKVGDKTVTGIQLGPAPVGPEIKGVEKRGRFALPGTNAAIRGYLDKGNKFGGSNPSSWDKDDIHPIDRLIRRITPKDLENAEKNRTYQELQEQFKNKRFAGKKLEIFWGDTPESVQERIDMMKSVSNKKKTEPSRVIDDLENARILGEAQNASIRALNTSNSNEAFLKNKFFYLNNQEKTRQGVEDNRYNERTELENNRYTAERETEKLRYEERLQNDLRREKAQLDRDERRDDFMMQQYNDQQDRLDRAEEREDRRAVRAAAESIFNVLGSFF